MSRNPIPTAGSAKSKALQWALIVEGVVALALGSTGLWFVVTTKPAPPWTGFGLIALGLLLYMLRGQVITKLSVGKDGVAWEMAQAAKQIAEEAKQEATIAKGVASQYAPPAALASGRQKTKLAAVAETADRWVHPDLKPGKKVANDPQKNQWGGTPVRNGRRLDAKVTRADKDWYDIVMTITSLDPDRPVTGRCRFHLHDSFSQDVVAVRPADGIARLDRYAYGAFTIGAEVEDEPDTYLELDMAAADFDAPSRFKEA